MNIIKENIDNLNAVLKVNIIKQDYEETVEKTLKDYRKKIHLPGFRAGMVPFGLVKKKYGTSVLLEEINKMVSSSIQNYLVDNKIQILGQPLPKVTDAEIDWQHQSEFEFLYELGLAPEIDLKNLENNLSATEFKIKIDDADVEKELKNLRQYYATTETINQISEDNYFKGKCIQIMDEHDTKNVKGFNKEITFFVNDLENSELKQKFLEKKINDKIKLNIPDEFNNNNAKIASAFQINEEEAGKLKGKFEIEIMSAYKKILPELNQEFFNKVCGEGKIDSKEGLMVTLKEDIKKTYENYSIKRLEGDMVQAVLKKYNLKLPDVFLKKWLKVIDEEKGTNHEIDKEYDNWSESMKWHLIQNKILEENNLKPTHDDVRNDIKNSLKNVLFKKEENYDEDTLKYYTEHYLKDHKHFHNVEDRLINQRTIAFLRSKCAIQIKEVTFNEFSKV